jgi:hypothetical protein
LEAPNDTAGPVEKSAIEHVTAQDVIARQHGCRCYTLPPDIRAGFKEVFLNLRNTSKLAYDWAVSKGVGENCAKLLLLELAPDHCTCSPRNLR